MVNDDLREAINAVNRVHGDGSLPSIPFSMRSALSDIRGDVVDGLLRVEVTIDGHVVARSIQIRYGAPHRSLVAIHEIGHLLDLNGLPGIGFASADPEDVELVGWRSAVAESRAVDLLTLLCQSRNPVERHRALRLSRPEELWARSYAQFVAIRSGDQRLWSSLNAQRQRRPEDETSDAVYFPVQWDDDDFGTIDLAIEDLLRRMEWIT